VDTGDLERRRWDGAIIALGPVLGAAIGALTNVITSSWNWWLFLTLLVLISLTSVAAVLTSSRHRRGHKEITSRASNGSISTLPPRSAIFVGRKTALQALSKRINQPQGRPVVHMITGSPGSGKTELALQAGYRLQGRYPDGQLFIGLRSHSGRGGRLDVQDSLINAISAFSPDSAHNKLDVDQLSARWRSDTSGKRVLIVLDDASEASQVWPLMPNSSQSLVIITTRKLISGIDPDSLIELETLSIDEARQMITEIAQRASQAPDPSVMLLVAQAREMPLTLRHIADQLVANFEGGLLTPLPDPGELGDPASTFRAAVRSLGETEQLAFRRAGLYPGPHATAEMLGALVGLPAADTARILEVLHQRGLVTRPDPAGYGLQDLVRSVAAEESHAHDTPAELAAARQRLFDRTAETIASLNVLITAPRASDTVPRARVPVHPADEFGAYEWFERYFEDYRAIARLAISDEWHSTWQLTDALSYFMRVRRNIPQAITLSQAALQIAETAGEDHGTAVTNLQIGTLERSLSNYAAAEEHIYKALPIFKRRNDILGQANCFTELGIISHNLTHFAEARDNTSRALELFNQAGDIRGIANSEGNLGMTSRVMGDYNIAREHLSRALTLFTELRNVRNEGWILIELGTVDRQTGGYVKARERFSTARDVFEQAGDHSGVAWARRELGITDRLTGQHASALQLLSASLETFNRIGSKRNVADAHVELGALHRETGSYQAALRESGEALHIYRDIGNARGAAWADLQIGTIERLQGDSRAVERFRAAISAYNRIDDKSGLARAHLEYGTSTRATDPGRAREHLGAALALYEQMGAPETAEVQRQLEGL